MNRRMTWLAGTAIAVAIAIGGATMVLAGDNDDDAPLTGTDLDRASRAALEHTGGGTVIESEAGDDGAAYGVEIRLEDGIVVEVRLDADFHVTGQETDDDGAEGPDDNDGGAEDDGAEDDGAEGPEAEAGPEADD